MPEPARDHWMELCAQAAEEKDPDKFIELIRKINDLLEEKERRLGIVSAKAERASAAAKEGTQQK